MTPLESYQIALQSPEFSHDPAQEEVIRALQSLYEGLIQQQQRSPLSRLWSRLGRQPIEPVTGLYFWGGVGRGKTFLVDLFYDALPFENKLRLHFHRFMYLVHAELKMLNQVPDPLDKVAESFAQRAKLLCLDEFLVTDIGDAMILAGLLQGLFSRGVTLVTTANVAPNDLYLDGLQRSRFMPAIRLLQNHCDTIHVGGSVDYRLRELQAAQIYLSPLGSEADEGMKHNFQQMVPVDRHKRDFIRVNDRQIPVVRWADGVVWFDFTVLCGQPRATADYIEIARFFHTVMISDVPVMNEAWDDRAKRLILLIDHFYDRRVKLILSAEAPAEELYQGRRLQHEFQRTCSRLQEMRSREYLAKAHLP